MRLLNKAEEAAADILKAFEHPNELPKPLAQVFVNRRDGSPCRKWSWRNQLVVAIRGHAEARGYRQWEKVGRQVKPGEKAFRILSPMAKKIIDEETEEERTAVCGFTGTAVFGLSQTEGEPLPDRSEETRRWLDSLPLRDVAKAWGLSVEAYNGAGGGLLGQYRHGTGIALGVENLSTWCHELVHAADDRNGKLRGKKVRKETVAELGGAVLLSILGYENKTDLGGCWEGCSFRLMLCGECRAAIVVKVSPELLPTACGESQRAYRALPVAVCEAFSAARYCGLSALELVEDSPWVPDRHARIIPTWRRYGGDLSVGGELVRFSRASPSRCGPRQWRRPALRGFLIPPRHCGSTSTC